MRTAWKARSRSSLIIKIVNASPEDIRINIELSDVSVAGNAVVTELQSDDSEAVNQLGDIVISPKTSELKVGGTFGYLSMCYSVTVIRIPVK